MHVLSERSLVCFILLNNIPKKYSKPNINITFSIAVIDKLCIINSLEIMQMGAHSQQKIRLKNKHYITEIKMI